MKQRRFRIFISHSANRAEEPATQNFLDSLVGRLLAEPGLEPLTDQKDLQAGDEWLQRLYAWMGLCDASVVVLSPRAVTRENSTWVPREANMLLWRKALDQHFVILPVLIGGLEPSALASNPFLVDSRLAELQIASALADADKIEVIVQALKDNLGCVATRLAFDPLQVYVEDCLQRYAPATSVENALERHFGADVWQPFVVAAQKLSLKLVCNAVSASVDPVIADVTLGSQGEAQLGARLFEALFPMRLPAECAGRLLTLCLEQEGHGSVLVNACDTWIIGMLLRAATGLPEADLLRNWRIIELPGGWGDNDCDEITAFLGAELARVVLGTTGWDDLGHSSDPTQRLKEQLVGLAGQLAEARKETGTPTLVCTSYSKRWEELAPLLIGQFPNTVFVLWTGDALPQPTADSVTLMPAWPGGSDYNWRLAYQRKLQRFKGGIT